ncbi:putative lipoprotein [Streptomyces asoensis]|uniref:Lipoprotein n=2 Tax=Streptomyces asoensis TaxID=249586 RepID=A0ABQ3S3U4_9ACTN|nr:putative lipoprotein [Streptomyces asoensis]GHI62773.1 putative lipoprotein [Streptomyces asoensis]
MGVGRMKHATLCRAGLSIAAVTLLTSMTACSPSGGSEGGSGSGGSGAFGKGGDGDPRLSPLAALRTAERSTEGADSAKVESSTTMGSMMSMTADGALGWGDGLTGTLTITYTGGTMADTMRRMGTTSMEARYLPDAYYARMGDTFARQAGGKHWIKYAYDDLESLGGSSGAYLKDQMQNTTPNQSVKLLLASGDVRKVGTERVRGQRTTHYSGTVDVADLAEKNSGLDRGRLDDLRKTLEQAGVTTETVDIWVDDRDLLVKKVEKGETTAGAYTQTAYYSDYGTKVSAEVPPASDTADFSALLEQQGTGAGS